ncbi:carbohydrate ABC transporter permease [Paenibacillus pasadenensis]|uniref:Putative rhamnose oligosaccharide ABC transport system, permease component n=1 Tax=Paenibacillus pasadenensis TaxID=217090 RepID=A0A2N5N1R0_9BACL|nr:MULTISPECIES: carbohydrate ABC transporter permease [Paenibacillus]PLT44255.1 putative rhamnose oligosaccharide ABC transport system, permease component [Paenibacillus pasadenensis]QGG54779.1 ABC transporter permease subunit [Paenibacillus sp. B01]
MAWKTIKWPVYHLFAIALAVLMLYPVLWMLMSSFKESRLIFVTAESLLPDKWVWSNYADGWKGTAGYPFMTYIWNSLVIVVLSTIGAVLSSSLIAFGFARLSFRGRNLWFALMMVTLMLPHDVVLVPQYVIFTKLGWLNSIAPIVVPQFFGIPFFIFLMVQFIRTIPRELDEAATIDGCGKLRLYARIILPLLRSSLATAAIFSFYWRWEDLLGPVLYLNSPDKYTVSMALKMFLDSESTSNWGAMFAMSIVSLVPVIALFFAFQKHIVQGMATSGLKG